MGASGAKAQKTTSLVPARRRIVLRKWRQRDHGVQVCAVARHEERADAGFAIPADGTLSWTQTDDFHQWPKDPPLSSDGQEAASRLGRELHEAVAGLGTRLHVVVSSPYFRCVQTAAHICQSLGGRTQMLIDRSLGEVYSPEIMGEHEPAHPTRPADEALAYCKHLGVRCHVTPLGQTPAWPENLERARQRFIGSFVGYLSRSSRTRRNFVLVTHADAVGATLSVMPSRARKQLIQKVEYGGYFLAHRKIKACRADADGGSEDPTASVTTSLMQMSPSNESITHVDGGRPEAAGAEAAGAEAEQRIARALKRGECADAVGKLKRESWQVRAQGVVFRPKHESGHNYGLRFASSLMRFSPYSRRKIKKVLGELPDVPLESFTPKTLSRRSSQNSRLSGHSAISSHSSNSSISQSTYIFGNVGSQVDTLSSISSVESAEAASRRLEQEADAQGGAGGAAAGPRTRRRVHTDHGHADHGHADHEHADTPTIDTSLHVPTTVPGALQQPDSPVSPMFVKVHQPDTPTAHRYVSSEASDCGDTTPPMGVREVSYAPVGVREVSYASAPTRRNCEVGALTPKRKEERSLSAGNVLQPPQLSEIHGAGKAHSGHHHHRKKGGHHHRKADRALSAGCPLPARQQQQPDRSEATKPHGPSPPSSGIQASPSLAPPSSTSGSTIQSPPSSLPSVSSDMMGTPPVGHVPWGGSAGGGGTKKSANHGHFFNRRDKRASSAGSTLHQSKGSDGHKDHARAGAPASTSLKVSATGSRNVEEHRAKGSAPDFSDLGAASSKKSSIGWASTHKGDVTMAFDLMLPSHKQPPPNADGDSSRRDHTAGGLFTKRGSMSSTLFPQHRKASALPSSPSWRKEEPSSSATTGRWPGKALKDVDTSPSPLPVVSHHSDAAPVPTQSASIVGSALFQRRQRSQSPTPKGPTQSASFVGSALFQRRQAASQPPPSQPPPTTKAEPAPPTTTAPAPTASFVGSALFQRRQARLRDGST